MFLSIIIDINKNYNTIKNINYLTTLIFFLICLSDSKPASHDGKEQNEERKVDKKSLAQRHTELFRILYHSRYWNTVKPVYNDPPWDPKKWPLT